MKLTITKQREECTMTLQGRDMEIRLMDGKEMNTMFCDAYRAASKVMDTVPVFRQVTFTSFTE